MCKKKIVVGGPVPVRPQARVAEVDALSRVLHQRPTQSALPAEDYEKPREEGAAMNV